MQYAGTHKAIIAVALVSQTTPDHSPAQGSSPFQLPVKQMGSSASEALKASSASTVATSPTRQQHVSTSFVLSDRQGRRWPR